MRGGSGAGIDYAYWAKIVLQALIRRVRNFQGGDKSIAYSALAAAVGYPKPHTGSRFAGNIGKTLTAMAELLEETDLDGPPIPLIQALVVSKSSGLPGDGFCRFGCGYSSLSADEKNRLVRKEHDRIFEFGDRWDDVLERIMRE